jgi:hypothetical protein
VFGFSSLWPPCWPALAGLLRLLAGVLSATLLAGLLLARIGLILLTRLLVLIGIAHAAHLCLNSTSFHMATNIEITTTKINHPPMSCIESKYVCDNRRL